MVVTRPHALYRFFDATGVLLYVGITNNPARRFTQHGVDREWWHEVETIRMQRFDDRESVLAAEREAIKTEQPRYNIIHAGPPTTAEMSTSSSPAGDYPVSVGDVVALCLAPNHLGEAKCPVGMVDEVSRFGVKLSPLRWLSETFDLPRVLVPWHRVMNMQWAEKMSPEAAKERGYCVADWVPIYDCAPLSYTQTEWVHGVERAKENARTAADREVRRPPQRKPQPW